MNARLLECTPAQYHADPCEVPSLSASIAHVILAQSPLHAWHRHPRLGGGDAVQSPAMTAGTLAHALLLGADDRIVVVDADDWRTKAARERRDELVAAGKVPVLARDHAEVALAVDVWRLRLHEAGVVLSGQSEVAVEWAADGVLCRGMMDHLITHYRPGAGAIYDLKTTTASCHPEACARRAVDHGLDLQAAAYLEAVEALHPEAAGRVHYAWLWVELEPPHAVTVATPSGAMLALGRAKWRRAREVWQRCLSSSRWPGYTDGAQAVLEPPQWAIAAEIREEVLG